jgi:hypothetical protein
VWKEEIAIYTTKILPIFLPDSLKIVLYFKFEPVFPQMGH